MTCNGVTILCLILTCRFCKVPLSRVHVHVFFANIMNELNVFNCRFC